MITHILQKIVKFSLLYWSVISPYPERFHARKNRFCVKDFFSNFEQICRAKEIGNEKLQFVVQWLQTRKIWTFLWIIGYYKLIWLQVSLWNFYDSQSDLKNVLVLEHKPVLGTDTHSWKYLLLKGFRKIHEKNVNYISH